MITIRHMKKSRAIELLGGTVSAAAREVGVSHVAIINWPDELPPRIADRVYAALWRRKHGEITDNDPIPSEPKTAKHRSKAK